MKKSAYVSNVIFAFFVCFLLFLCLTRYHGYSLLHAFFCAVIMGTLAAVVTFLVLGKKRKKLVTEQKQAAERDDLMLYLATLSPRESAEFIRSVFCAAGESCSLLRAGGFFIVERENERVFPLFFMRPVDGDTLAAVLRVKGDKPKRVFCRALAPEAEALARRFPLGVATENECYRLIKDGGLLPEKYPFSPEKKGAFAKRKRIWFSKKNARGFLTGGTLLLLSSLITPFPYYYVLFGSILLLAAVAVKIFGYS